VETDVQAIWNKDTRQFHKMIINPLECKSNYSATSNNMKLVHWALVGCYIWYSEEGTRRGCSPTRPILTVPK